MEYAPFGRYLCDAPLVLAEAFFQKLQHSYSDLDFLLIPGDLVAHGVPFDVETPD